MTKKLSKVLNAGKYILFQDMLLLMDAYYRGARSLETLKYMTHMRTLPKIYGRTFYLNS